MMTDTEMFLWLSVAIGTYFLPIIAAYSRNIASKHGLLVFNLLGLIGSVAFWPMALVWIISLIWALSGRSQ